MTASAVLLVVTVGFLLAMLAVSAWMAQRLPPDGPVPVHFDIRGNADRLGSRWVVLSLLPASYLVLTGVIMAIGAAAPPGETDPVELIFGHVFASLVLLAAHGLVAFLLMRWARRQ